MNLNPAITDAELSALLAGHRDGAFVRIVALAVIRGALDIYTAARLYDLKAGTIYKAKLVIEGRLVETRAKAWANENGVETELKESTSAVLVSSDKAEATEFKPSSKMFL